MARHGTTPGVNRPAVAVLASAIVLGAASGGWAMLRDGGRTAAGPAAVVQATSTGPDAGPTTGPASTPAAQPSRTPATGAQASTPAARPAPSKAARSLPKGLTAADVGAGLRSASFPQRGSGRLVVVTGGSKAPGTGRVVTVRVEVEGGLPVDGRRFAAFALATLNDPRSWRHDGWTFARTDGAADVRLVLASPETSARLCRPLQTFGTMSCHSGQYTVLTMYRWAKGIPEYGKDLTGYRHYVVNHEVGHALGKGHQMCPGAGKRAPVMMQQTKGLKGCRPNGWPYP